MLDCGAMTRLSDVTLRPIRLSCADPDINGEWEPHSLMHTILDALVREQRMVAFAQEENGIEVRIAVNRDEVVVTVSAKVSRRRVTTRSIAAA